MAEKKIDGVVLPWICRSWICRPWICRRICVAHGSIAVMCTRRLSMVPALAAAVPAINHDSAHHDLDGQHCPYLLRLAFAQSWTPVAGSGLDYAAGIRSPGSVRCSYRVAQVPATGNAPGLHGRNPVVKCDSRYAHWRYVILCILELWPGLLYNVHSIK